MLSWLSMSRPISRERLEEGVLDVLKSVSRRPIEPTLDSDLAADLGFDSLLTLEAIAELEDRFDLSIPLNEVPLSRKVSRIVAHLEELLEERET